VSCSTDGAIKVWDGASSRCVNTFAGAHGCAEVRGSGKHVGLEHDVKGGLFFKFSTRSVSDQYPLSLIVEHLAMYVWHDRLLIIFVVYGLAASHDGRSVASSALAKACVRIEHTGDTWLGVMNASASS
jgi:hypothetical protein